MQSRRWARIKSILNGALDRRSNERAAYLNEVCGPSGLTRAELESLLGRAERPYGLLAEPLIHVAAACPPAASSTTDAVPPYTLTSATARVGAVRDPFFWVAIFLGVVFVVLCAGVVWKVHVNGDSLKHFGWTTGRADGAWRIATVDPHGPAASRLRTGDTLLAFDGDPRAGVVGPRLYRQFLQVGSTYRLQVWRASDAELQREMLLPSVTVPGTALISLIYVVLATAFCAMGLLMGCSRPADFVTRVGCLTGCVVAYRLLTLGLAPYRGIGSGPLFSLDVLTGICEPWSLALSYHFLSLFALPDSRERLWTFVNRANYTICALIFVVTLPVSVATLQGRDSAIAVLHQYRLLGTLNAALTQATVVAIFQSAVFAACFAVVVRGYRLAADSDRKRRIRWVVLGCVVSFGPLFVLVCAHAVFQLFGASDIIESTAWRNLFHACNSLLIAVPASLAYAVVKHRVLGVTVVMRRSMQYLLARRVLQALLMLPLLGLLLPVLTDPHRELTKLFPLASVYSNVGLLSLLIVGLRQRERLRGWLDRRFFREAYAQETLLRETLSRLKHAASVEDIAGLVSHTVGAALHPSFICIAAQRSPEAGITLIESPPKGRDLQGLTQAISKQLGRRAERRPFEVLLLSPSAPIVGDTALVVPVVSHSLHPIGFFLLGEKLAEEPYGATDRDLLQGIADQVAVVQETLWLRAQVERDHQLRRDVLGHIPGSSVRLLRECAMCGACVDSEVERCPADGGEITHRLPVERVIGGRYRLDRHIGAGGMGTVYEAVDVALQRTVAVKLLLATMFGNRSALRRFAREARAMARLDHPNIVRVFDYGEVPDGAYLVMERIYGAPWRAEMNRRGPLSWGTVANWMDQLLTGLAEAHRAGVLHRDLKPENVLVTVRSDGSDRLALADFGLASLDAADGKGHSLTAPGVVMGTIGYLAPEQLQGDTCDARSDVFAAGMMALEAITGLAPWRERRELSVVIDALVTALGTDRPSVQTLARVLRTCLATDRRQRFESAGALRHVLVPALCDCAADLGAASSPAQVATADDQ